LRPRERQITSLNRVTRGENLLNRLVDRGTLTDEGKAALIAALDPFHDARIDNLKGWPDLNTAPSVVRTLNYSTTVTSPGDGGCIVAWTNPFFMTKDPSNVENRLAEYNRAGNTLVGNTVFNYPVGSTMVMSFPDDTDWRFAAASAFNNLLVPEDDFLNGSSRIIGWGMEVHDVTAELYKQGTLTVFSVPQASVVPETFNLSNPDTTGCFSGHVYKRWPNSLSEAVLYPDSRQWEAADGVYTVIPCMGPDNPAAQPSYTQPILPLNATLADQIGGINDGLNIFVPPPKAAVPDGQIYWNPAKLVPFHSRGVALTGLNANSTFTINVKYYVETFPALDDKTIMTLASPSAPHDPVALEMISRAVQQLPSGVPVGDNPGGEWFMSVLGKVLPMLGTGLSALTGLPLGAAGTALGGLATDTAEKWRREAQASQKASENAVKSAVRAAVQTAGAGKQQAPAITQAQKAKRKANAKKRQLNKAKRAEIMAKM